MGADALLFDLDDTLSDWNSASDAALRAVVARVPGIGAAEAERFRRAVREIWWVSRDGCVVHRNNWRLLDHSEVAWERALNGDSGLASAAVEAYRRALHPLPYPDVHVIPRLARTVRIGLLSNNPGALAILSRFGVAPDFTAVTTALAPYAKPHPEAFEKAVRALGVEPGRTLYVGDSITHDIEPAIGAGLQVAWIDRYGDDAPLPPGAIRISSLLELDELLAG